MILDSSAVIAVVREELNHAALEDKLDRAATLAIGAPTMFETAMVAIGRFGEEGGALVAGFIGDWEVEIVPFDARHWRAAIDAFARYGKGRHPAGLNYGDCMTYATARIAELPLLFTGEDFARTDVSVA